MFLIFCFVRILITGGLKKGTQLWKLKEAATYTITFDDQKGNLITVKAKDGTTVSFPENPIYDGFTFDGWFDAIENGNAVTSFVADKDMTFYTHWTEIPKTEEVKKEEVKPASKSSDTSDTTNVALYAIGVIAAIGVAGMMIRNRMHKSK